MKKYVFSAVQKQRLMNMPQYYNIDFDKLEAAEFDSSLPSPRMRGDEHDLLDVIYSRDPRTGLPKGDVSVFVSAKTSPEVRQFILDNLMFDKGASSGVPDGHDDFAIELCRKSGETPEEYAMRISEIYQSSAVELSRQTASVPVAESSKE